MAVFVLLPLEIRSRGMPMRISEGMGRGCDSPLERSHGIFVLEGYHHESCIGQI